MEIPMAQFGKSTPQGSVANQAGQTRQFSRLDI
jgi:hypothetical protein